MCIFFASLLKGLRMVVQTEKDPKIVEGRMEQFLAGCRASC